MFKSYETWKRNLASYNIIMNKYLIFYLGGGGEEWSGGVGWGGEGGGGGGGVGGGGGGGGRGVLDELVVKNIFLRFMHW